MARHTAKERVSRRAEKADPPQDAPPAVYLPGMALGEGETLEADPSAYVMLHAMAADWPCLSFDVLRDPGAPGDDQVSFPVSGAIVTGTQADDASRNALYVVRYANLHRTQARSDSDSEDDSEEEESGDEDAQGERSRDPRQHVVALPHAGGVNRVRACASFVATWSDAGAVHVWDVRDARDELLALPQAAPSAVVRRADVRPVHSVGAHSAEGFALAWSSDGRQLLSGDCAGEIALTDATPTGFLGRGVQRLEPPHSVEDLAWSPRERTVFASVGTDGALRLWDTRLPPGRCALAVQVRPAGTDVNVLSWSALEPSVIATGADDGHLAAWDLRRAAAESSSALFANDAWHAGAITSIEWSAHDASVLAAAGADDQVTLWDLSVADAPPADGELAHVPPQLLFIHQGQREVKELHWAPHHTGVLITTALSGFNIFRTISV